MAPEKKKISGKKAMISPDTVRHVAGIARLGLSEDEVKRFQRDLNDVLQAFKELDKAKTDKVEASFQPEEIRDVMRDDRQEECLAQSKALENTAHKEKGFFRGPRVV